METDRKLPERSSYVLTIRPKEHILSPLVCMKSVKVLPSTGESSSEAKSSTCGSQKYKSHSGFQKKWEPNAGADNGSIG